MRIGILGGSFNPIHYGHLLIAQSAYENLYLDKIIFMPTGKAPHKKLELSPKIRYEMTKLAIEDNDKFDICDIEINKTDYSYTIETISELKSRFDSSVLYFIIGADSLFQIETWHNFEKLLSCINFAVANRYYQNEKDPDRLIKRISELESKYNANIEVFDNNIYELSSTQIRARVKEGLSIKYMLPDNLRRYILDNEIYK